MEFSEESNVLEDTFDDQLVNKKVNEEDRTFEESIQGVQEEPQIRGKHERSEGDEFTDYTSSSSIVDNNNISKKQRIEDSEALPKEDENGTGSNDDMRLLVSNEDGQGTLAEFSNDNQTRLDELHTTPLNNVMDLATNGENSQSENRDNNESKLAFDYEEVAFDGSESKLDENNNFNNGNNNSNNTNVKTEQPPLAIGEFSTSSGSMEISLSPAEDLAKRIRKQVDFYFSEANLRDDTFLKTEIRKNPEKWVDISCILTFNRMRVLTDSVSVVADAMRTSSVVKVSPDGLKLRRKIAMRANPPDPRLCRIHVAPLPPDTIIEDLEHVFGGLGAGEVRMTRIRKPTEEDLKIDPSPPKEAILEFETPEIAREVVAASVRQSVTLRGHTPQVEMLIDWLNRIRRGREEADRFSNYTNFQPGTLVTLEYIPRDTTKEDILYSCGPKAGIKLIDYVRGAEMGVVHFETPECAHNAVAKLIKDGIAGRKVQIACVMSRAGEEAYRADVEKRKEEVRLGSVFRGRGGPRGGMGRGGPRGRGGRGGFGRGGGRGGSGGRGGGRGGPRGGMGRGRGSGRGGPGRDSRGSAQSRSSMDRDDRSRQRSSSDGRNSGPRDDREQRGSGGFSDHREDRPRFDDRRDDRPRFDDRNDRKHPMHNREDDRDRKRQRHDEGNASGAPGNHRR